ncbi:carboxyltransferase domain-containing protein, partial [Acinetobacter baumannii]
RETPGGWRLIGTTDAPLFAPDSPDPVLLTPGARVRFVPQRARVSAPGVATAGGDSGSGGPDAATASSAPGFSSVPLGPPALRVLTPGAFATVQD